MQCVSDVQCNVLAMLKAIQCHALMIVPLTNASKTMKEMTCLQSAMAKESSSNASEDDDQPPIGNKRGTNSVIGSDNDEE